MELTLLLALTLGQAALPAPTDADLVRLAAADVALVPASEQEYVRYFTLNSIPIQQRAEAYLVFTGHLQHLSRESDIVRPVLVPDSGGCLLRVFTTDYRWDIKTFETLADADPYYHVRLVQEVDEVEKWGDYDPRTGKYSNVKEKKTGKKIRQIKQSALAPWLSYGKGGKEALAALVASTRSKTPILRADWFFNQTAAQQNRNPGYYEFLAIKVQDDFEKLIGFDAKLAKNFRIELREAISESSVTLQPRGIGIFDALGARYYKTFDFIVAKDRQNPLRVLGVDIEKDLDASEQYGMLANGFWATAIFKRDRTTQDAAPGNIATDSESASNDKQVHVNVSCLRCHGAGGLRSLDGWVRNLIHPPVALTSPDPYKARELRQQYLRDVASVIERDKGLFEQAVRTATGWDSKTYIAKYAGFWSSYEDLKVTTAVAAADLHITEVELRAALTANLKAGTLDPVAAMLIHPPEKQKRLLIRQYEEIYPLLRQYLFAKESAQ